MKDELVRLGVEFQPIFESGRNAEVCRELFQLDEVIHEILHQAIGMRVSLGRPVPANRKECEGNSSSIPYLISIIRRRTRTRDNVSIVF